MHRGTYTTMLWLSLLGVLLFHPNCSSQCRSNQPTDCEFKDDFCDWEHHNWTRDQGYAFLSTGELSGDMTSEVRCVSSNISHCLKFRFRLKRNKNKNSLKVLILYSANYSRSLLWSYSNKTGWTDAHVPVETASDFALIISALSSNAGNDKAIRVDNLKYETQSCKIKPFSATLSTSTSPRTTRTTTTMSTSRISTTRTTTTTSTTTTTTTETTTGLMTTPRTSTTNPAISTTDNNSSPCGVTAAGTPPSDTGIIIGVIVGGIVAVGVAIVDIIVVRRRRDRLPTMMKKNTRPEDNAYHNSAFNSDGENITGLNLTGVYHILEPGAAAVDPSERTTGQRHSTETRNPIDNSISSRECAHQGTAVPNRAEDDYNSLDFEKKLGAAGGGDVSEGQMDQTYSHLNEVDEDTYDELSREKKREVVDGVYSRVYTEGC